MFRDRTLALPKLVSVINISNYQELPKLNHLTENNFIFSLAMGWKHT